MKMSDALLGIKVDEKTVNRKRREIHERIIEKSSRIGSGKITSIAPADLKLILDLYDELFFNNWFKNKCSSKIEFALSKRMTRSAGMVKCSMNKKTGEKNFILQIGVNFFYNYDELDNKKNVCGIETKDSLEGLLLVFEHEICHIIEFINYGKSSCRGKRYKTIVGNLFGHVSSYHQLPTYKQIAGEKHGVVVGDSVVFDHEGRRKTGFINAINKRATVMVRDDGGKYMDTKKNRYVKFYVPLSILEKA
jgi:predicted SprT family Zn-dependent metalloprotease